MDTCFAFCIAIRIGNREFPPFAATDYRRSFVNKWTWTWVVVSARERREDTEMQLSMNEWIKSGRFLLSLFSLPGVPPVDPIVTSWTPHRTRSAPPPSPPSHRSLGGNAASQHEISSAELASRPIKRPTGRPAGRRTALNQITGCRCLVV